MTPTSRQRLLPSLSNGYLWIFVAALALRGIYLWQALRNNELLTYPVVDARVYMDWAHDILAGKWLWYEAKTYTPGMPVWLAGWLAIFGERPWLHFAGFHLLGALQAVLLGKTGEIFWHRRAGLATGWLAALYWPLIIFEGSYYAEPLAIFSLTTCLYLLARWSRGRGGWGALLAAGFGLGFAILVRSNTMLCAPVLAWWVFVAARAAARRASESVVAKAGLSIGLLALPSIALCLPVMLWNLHVNGVAELRTGAWLSVYLGNNPEYRGLVVPVGERYNDFVYLPIRAGKIERAEQNQYWREQVFRVMREQRGDWLALLGRKALMLTGSFEISQEIDVGVFRTSSSVLSLPIWPGWALAFPLAIAAAVAMAWRGDARRGWPLLAFATVYLFSVSPVQCASRYRLPTVVAMLPLAGWALSEMLSLATQREGKALGAIALPAAAAAVLAWPDWLGLAEQKIINHSFLVGLKREEAKDDAGAAEAFRAGATWNPADPDCPYRLGEIALRHQQPLEAEKYFRQSLALFPSGHEAVLGLAECALAAGHPDETLAGIDRALQLAPGNRDALLLRIRAYTAKRDWLEVANACGEVRQETPWPTAIAFAEVRALSLAGQLKNAVGVLDDITTAPWVTPLDRVRAAYLAGLLTWRLPGGRPEAALRWQKLAEGPPGLFSKLAQLLTGKSTAEELRAEMPQATSDPFVVYALAAAAIQQKDIPGAVRQLEALVARRHARDLPEAERDLLEIWALDDLSRAPKRP